MNRLIWRSTTKSTSQKSTEQRLFQLEISVLTSYLFPLFWVIFRLIKEVFRFICCEIFDRRITIVIHCINQWHQTRYHILLRCHFNVVLPCMFRWWITCGSHEMNWWIIVQYFKVRKDRSSQTVISSRM